MPLIAGGAGEAISILVFGNSSTLLNFLVGFLLQEPQRSRLIGAASNKQMWSSQGGAAWQAVIPETLYERQKAARATKTPTQTGLISGKLFLEASPPL